MTTDEKIAALGRVMAEKLGEHMDRRGWREEALGYLLRRLLEEAAELYELFLGPLYNEKQHGLTGADWREAVLKEAADVANFAMMIADGVGAFEIERPR